MKTKTSKSAVNTKKANGSEKSKGAHKPDPKRVAAAKLAWTRGKLALKKKEIAQRAAKAKLQAQKKLAKRVAEKAAGDDQSGRAQDRAARSESSLARNALRGVWTWSVH